MQDKNTLRALKDFAPNLSVGIMTADLMSLGTELSLLQEVGTKIVHIDVMDGVFCPKMTVGPPLIKAMKTALLKDVHLMIADPLPKVRDYVAAGADIITIHAEACMHPHRTLQEIGAMVNANEPARGLIRGVALNPGTPLNTLEPLLDEMELILLLAVNPGWSGQGFIPSTFDRIRKTRDIVERAGGNILLAVDGGITQQNALDIARTGVDIIVAGSAVFDGKSPRENARAIMNDLRSEHTKIRLDA